MSRRPFLLPHPHPPAHPKMNEKKKRNEKITKGTICTTFAHVQFIYAYAESLCCVNNSLIKNVLFQVTQSFHDQIFI